jgi:GNAT superfamily N-acetyltransferase
VSYTDGPVAIVPAEPHMGAAWRELFVSYCAAGGVHATDVSVDRVWSWIKDPSAQTSCLVASVGGELVGFAHFRVFERPITASTGLWIDDLYVDPSCRGRGVAGALIGAVRAEAGQGGHDVVRWTTRETNITARRAYDRLATRSPVVVYNAEPEPITVSDVAR